MAIYLFVSEVEPGVKAFTADQSGANLPAAYAPWSISEGRRSTIRSREDDDPVSLMVKRRGYFLVSGKVEGRRRRPAW
jgi:hypothetical protein